MKNIIALFLVFLSFESFANAPKGNIEMVKARILSNLDQRLNHLKESRACVAAATDHEVLKKCMNTMRETGKAMREENQTKRRNDKIETKANKAK